MKEGDLVRWTHPDDNPLGIILDVISHPDQYGNGEVVILWSPSKVHPIGHKGIYPTRHRYMEIVGEAG